MPEIAVLDNSSAFFKTGATEVDGKDCFKIGAADGGGIDFRTPELVGFAILILPSFGATFNNGGATVVSFFAFDTPISFVANLTELKFAVVNNGAADGGGRDELGPTKEILAIFNFPNIGVANGTDGIGNDFVEMVEFVSTGKSGFELNFVDFKFAGESTSGSVELDRLPDCTSFDFAFNSNFEAMTCAFVGIDVSGLDASKGNKFELELAILDLDKDETTCEFCVIPVFKFPDADFIKDSTILTFDPDNWCTAAASEGIISNFEFVRLVDEDVFNFCAGAKPCLRLPGVDLDNDSAALNAPPLNWDDTTSSKGPATDP